MACNGMVAGCNYNEDMKRELSRLSTFATFPVVKGDPFKLAKAGYYYEQELNKVHCFCCDFEVDVSFTSCDVHVACDVHLILSPSCPELAAVANIPLGVQLLFRGEREADFQDETKTFKLPAVFHKNKALIKAMDEIHSRADGASTEASVAETLEGELDGGESAHSSDGKSSYLVNFLSDSELAMVRREANVHEASVSVDVHAASDASSEASETEVKTAGTQEGVLDGGGSARSSGGESSYLFNLLEDADLEQCAKCHKFVPKDEVIQKVVMGNVAEYTKQYYCRRCNVLSKIVLSKAKGVDRKERTAPPTPPRFQ